MSIHMILLFLCGLHIYEVTSLNLLLSLANAFFLTSLVRKPMILLFLCDPQIISEITQTVALTKPHISPIYILYMKAYK